MEPPSIPQVSRKKYLKDDNWEPHRDFITGWYHKPGMTTKKIQDKLENDRDFTVTERQIKGKIKKWSLAKNVQSSEMAFIAHKQQHRVWKQTVTRFRVRGQPVSHAKIVRWEKGPGNEFDELIALQTPSDISYSPASVRSPLPSNVDISLSSPVTVAHGRTDWSPEPISQSPFIDQGQISNHFEPEMDTFSLTQILTIDEGQFEGQSPAPFTPYQTPASSPKILSAHVHHEAQSQAFGISRPFRSSGEQRLLEAASQEAVFAHSISSHPTRYVDASAYDHSIRDVQPATYDNRKKRFREKDELDLDQRMKELKYRFGPRHPATLDTMARLAQVYKEQGRYRSAEVVFKEIAETRYTVLGQDDLGTIAALVDLADIYITQSKIQTSEKILRQLYKKIPTIVSPTSKLSLSIRNTLGEILSLSGNIQEAEKLLRESIEIGAQFLEADNNLLIRSRFRLAIILIFRGELTEAEKILLELLKLYDLKEASEAVNTLFIRSRLGELYRQQGDFQKSEVALQRVLNDLFRILGPEHDDTLLTQCQLSEVLYSQQKYRESLSLLQDAFEKYKKTLGNKHKSTLECQLKIARAENRQERYEEAEGMAKEVLKASEDMLGQNHNISCQALNELGVIYQGRGRLYEALSMYDQAAMRSARGIGAENPWTIHYQRNSAAVQQMIEQVVDFWPVVDVSSGDRDFADPLSITASVDGIIIPAWYGI